MDWIADNLGAILPIMDWLSRASLSGRRVHAGPPLTMQTLLIALWNRPCGSGKIGFYFCCLLVA